MRVHPKAELRVENKAAEAAQIYLYDEISWWGISSAQFVAELNGITSPSVDLFINSPGGDVNEGTAIYNALRRHGARVNIVVDGIAASIASVIAQAGDTITMQRGSMMMIHQAWGIAGGFASDMRAYADTLDLMTRSIAGIYQGRAGGTVDDWLAAMQANGENGTWYSAEEAVTAGLADSVEGQMAAAAKVDLTIFRNWGAKPEQGKQAPPDWQRENLRRVAASMLEVAGANAH